MAAVPSCFGPACLRDFVVCSEVFLYNNLNFRPHQTLTQENSYLVNLQRSELQRSERVLGVSIDLLGFLVERQRLLRRLPTPLSHLSLKRTPQTLLGAKQALASLWSEYSYSAGAIRYASSRVDRLNRHWQIHSLLDSFRPTIFSSYHRCR